jgi:hypothetical protein
MRHLALRFAAAAVAALLCASAPAQETVRPEIGKPLQAAQELIRAHKFKDALATLREADAVAGKSAFESYTVERMRLSAASGAGDADTASKAYEAAQASGRMSSADKQRMTESLALAYYRARDYVRATQWSQRHSKEGGNNPAVRSVLIQSQYLSGDYAGAAKELTAEIQAAERAGHAPDEERLKLLMNAALKLNDNHSYVWAVEKLVTHHPKKEYWADLLSHLQRQPNFSDRLALDTYRLAYATGALSRASDYLEMTQLALQAGFPAEAKRVIDQGFAGGVLGTAADDERDKRLRDLVAKRLAEDNPAKSESDARAQAGRDGTTLVNAGMRLVFAGQPAKGIALMQQGIATGNLKRPDDAKLHLGIAQVLAGEHGKAQTTFRSVFGSDGTADLARLWSLHARRKG